MLQLRADMHILIKGERIESGRTIRRQTCRQGTERETACPPHSDPLQREGPA